MVAGPSAGGGRVSAALLFLLSLGTWSPQVIASAAEWSTEQKEDVLPGWETTQTLFDAYRKGPMAQAVVAIVTRQCQWVSTETCRRRLEGWRAFAGLHPLAAQMLDRDLADLARARGDTESAVKHSGGLGYLIKWTYAVMGAKGEALADPVTGWVEPAAFFRPPSASALELETTVSAIEETQVALRLTGAWLAEACLNDDCFSVPVLERALWDDHVFGVTLRKGPNRLVVRFLAEGSSLRFAARLTRMSGAVLPMEYGVGGVLVRPIPKAARGDKTLVQGALGLLANDETAGYAFLRCLVVRGVALRGGVSAQEMLESQSPKKAWEWDLALACSQQTDLHHGFRTRAETVTEANLLTRLHGLAYHLYLGEYFYALGIALMLRQELETLGAPEDPVLGAQAAALVVETLGRCGLEMAQLPFLSALHGSWGKEVPRLLLALAESLFADGNRTDAVKILRPWAERFPGQSLIVVPLFDRTTSRVPEASTLMALKRLVALRPLVPGHRLALVSLLLRLGQADEARRVLSQAMTDFPNQPSMQREWASLSVESGDTESAVQALKSLLSTHPTDTWARALLTRLGGDAEEDPFKEITSDAIRSLAEELPDVSAFRMVGLMDRTMLRLQANGASTLWRLQAIMAVQPEEARSVVLSYLVENQGQVGRLQRAQILHPDGTASTLMEVPQPLLDDAQYNMFYDITNNTVEFPDLQAGDILVFGYRVDSLPSVLETPFAELVWLSDGIPKWNSRVDVAVPKGTELYSDVFTPDSTLRYQQAFFDRNGESFHSYDFKYLPRVPPERFAPGWFESATLVHVSRHETAKEFGSWYSGVLQKAGTTDKAMRDLVEEMRATAKDRKALIEELCRYVAGQIRYVGLELGVHRLRPHTPTNVLRHGFGDCKDKSLLLVSLLGLAGVEAQVVAVATGNRGIAPTSIVSSALFNHAIVYIPELDVYFDPTDTYLGLGTLPWAVMGVPGVVIKGTESRLIRTPEMGRAFSELRVKLRIEPASGTGEPASLEGTLTFEGQNARRILPLMDDEGTWSTELAEYLSGLFPVTQVLDWQSVTQEGARPTLTVTFKATWSPLSASSQSVMQSVASAVTTVLEQNRQLPVVIGFPYRLQYQVTWPSGALTLRGLRPEKEEGPEALYAIEELKGDGSDGFTLSFEQKSHRIPVDRVAEWRELVFRFREALGPLELSTHAK